VLGADAAGELGVHQLAHDDEPDVGAEAEQAVLDGAGDISQGDSRLHWEPGQASRLLGLGDGDDR
jgi:hypothetical protein